LVGVRRAGGEGGDGEQQQGEEAGATRDQPQSALGAAAERPASAAQLTGLNLAAQRIQPGSRFCCTSAVERKVSGRTAMVKIPISVSRWRVSTAIPFESEAKTAPSSTATAISTATPTTALWTRARPASART
jgi:hypothetical protein